MSVFVSKIAQQAGKAALMGMIGYEIDQSNKEVQVRINKFTEEPKQVNFAANTDNAKSDLSKEIFYAVIVLIVVLILFFVRFLAKKQKVSLRELRNTPVPE